MEWVGNRRAAVEDVYSRLRNEGGEEEFRSLIFRGEIHNVIMFVIKEWPLHLQTFPLDVVVFLYILQH